MRKRQIADADVMRIAIQQEIARSEESRYDHRLHGLLLVTAGQSCRQVAELLAKTARLCSAGCSVLSGAGSRDCAKGSVPAALECSIVPNGASSRGSCARARGSSRWRRACGTAQFSRSICAGVTEWIWECDSVKGYSAKWGFGCASRAPKSPRLIR